MNALVAIPGVLLIIIMLQDAFETIVLPRRVSRRFRLARLFYRWTWQGWKFFGDRMHDADRREYYLSFYGPLSLICLLALWAVGLVMGFALLQWSGNSGLNGGGRNVTFATDFYFSGTTFFTLGLGDVTPATALARALGVLEAGTGFGFLALLISYLPVIYQSFSRRETRITQLDAHAGSPPSAMELLRRHRRGHNMEELIRSLREWETWCAEILESHLSYPVLMYYRSQHERQSWVATLTTVLDVCALVLVGIDDLPAQSAWFTFAIARHTAVDLAQVVGVEPRIAQANRLSSEDFAKLSHSLAEVEVMIRDDQEAEERLLDLRRMYEPYVQGLSERLQMPLPPWFVDGEIIDDWQTSAWEHSAVKRGASKLQKAIRENEPVE